MLSASITNSNSIHAMYNRQHGGEQRGREEKEEEMEHGDVWRRASWRNYLNMLCMEEEGGWRYMMYDRWVQGYG